MASPRPYSSSSEASRGPLHSPVPVSETSRARGLDAARRVLARAAPGDCRDITARLDAGDPITSHLLAAPALAGTLDVEHPGFGIHLTAGPVLAAVEDAFFTAAAEALFTEAGRIARDRAAQHPGTSSQRGEA